MGYEEYKDLFDIAQSKGQYHMFVFDIKDSRSYGSQVIFMEKVALCLTKNVYNRLKALETKRNIVVLHKNIDLENNNLGWNFFREPFQFGDLFGFTIIKGSIDKKEVYQIFEEEKIKLNINFDFHMADGYYETDDYGEGLNKYYRGYCVLQLEELSKKTKKKKHKHL